MERVGEGGRQRYRRSIGPRGVGARKVGEKLAVKAAACSPASASRQPAHLARVGMRLEIGQRGRFGGVPAASASLSAATERRKGGANGQGTTADGRKEGRVHVGSGRRRRRWWRRLPAGVAGRQPRPGPKARPQRDGHLDWADLVAESCSLDVDGKSPRRRRVWSRDPDAGKRADSAASPLLRVCFCCLSYEFQMFQKSVFDWCIQCKSSFWFHFEILDRFS